MSELVPQNSGEIDLPRDDSGAGMVGLGQMQLPILTLDWTSKLFQCRLFEQQLRSFSFGLVRYYDNGRRNYESKFEQGVEAKPPTCYSLDGITGSRPREFKELVVANKEKTAGTPMKLPCYGDCNSCYLSNFGTDQIWTGAPMLYRGGPNCKNYGIAFVIWHREVLDPDNDNRPTGEILPIPAVLHVPATGTGPVRQALQMVRAQFGRSPQQFFWKAMGSGGGKRKDSMIVINQRKASGEEYNAIKQFEGQFDSFMEHYRHRMLSGKSNDNSGSVTIGGGDEVPFNEEDVA